MGRTYSLLLYGRLTRDTVKCSVWDAFKNPIAHQEWGGGKLIKFSRLEELWRSEKFHRRRNGGLPYDDQGAV